MYIQVKNILDTVGTFAVFWSVIKKKEKKSSVYTYLHEADI